MVYKVLLYNDFYREFEIYITTIPLDKLDYFMFMFVNWYDLKIDFEQVLKNSGYKFKLLKSNDYIYFSEIDEYHIKRKIFVNELFYDI